MILYPPPPVLVLLVATSSVGAQRFCGDSTAISALTLEVQTASVLLECPVPESLVLEAALSSWLWVSLAPGSMEEQLLPIDGAQANFSQYLPFLA